MPVSIYATTPLNGVVHQGSSTAQIGSTPNTARWSAMNWTIVATSSGGRAPPGRNTRTLSAGSHSPASAHGPRAPAPSTAPARSSSGLADAQHHAAPAAPTSAASPPCSRASAPPTAAPPTLRRGPPGAPRPSGRHVRALPEKTDLDVPETPSSQAMRSPRNPVRFTSDLERNRESYNGHPNRVGSRRQELSSGDQRRR